MPGLAQDLPAVDGPASRRSTARQRPPRASMPRPSPGHDPGSQVDADPAAGERVELVPARRQGGIVAGQQVQRPAEPVEDRAEEALDVGRRQRRVPMLLRPSSPCCRTSAGASARSVVRFRPMPMTSRGPRGSSTRSGRMPPSFRPATSTSLGQRIPGAPGVRTGPERVDHGDRRGQGEPRLVLGPEPVRGRVDPDRERQAPRVRPPRCARPGRGPAVCRSARTTSGQLDPGLDDQLLGQVVGRVDDLAMRSSSGRRASMTSAMRMEMPTVELDRIGSAHSSSLTRREPDEQLAGLDLLADGGQDLGDAARALGVEGRLHLHRFERQQLLPLADRVAGGDRRRRRPGRASGRRPGSGRPGRPWAASRTAAASERSTTTTSRGWPFSSKNTVRVPSACGSPTVRNLTISVLPGSMSTLDLLARLQAVEEHRRRQDAGVGVLLLVGGEVGEDLRVEQVATARRWSVGGAAELRLAASCAAASKSAGGRLAPGRPVERLAAARGRASAAPAGSRPAAGRAGPRRTRPPISGNASSRSRSSDVVRRQVVGHHEQRHVADDLRRRRDLDDVAEQLVDLGVHPADLGPAVGQAERLGLLVAGSCTARRASRGGRRRPSGRAGPLSNGG